MSCPPDDVTKKLLKKLQRAKKAQDTADEMFEDVIDAVRDALSEKDKAGGQEDRVAGNPHAESYHRFGDNPRLSAMLFMDIVGYSSLAYDEDQRAAIDSLNEIVRESLEQAKCNIHDVICLPTGDGMCLCFASPDQSLLVAEGVQRIMRSSERKNIRLRMGIHCGTVLRVMDLKGWFNLAGDAINMTQRAMDCGDEGHILCTKEAYKEFGRRREFKKSLNHLGFIEVKHGVNLELYNYVCSEKNIGNPATPKKAAAGTVNKSKPESRKSALRLSRQ